MKIDLIEPEGFVEEPWANGGGVAREIARSPQRSHDQSPFAVRVSVADITASGPFSNYTGYDRWLLLLEGKVGLSLGSSSQSVDLEAPGAAPLRFDGGTQITCTLKTPAARALNVFARRGQLDVRLVVAGSYLLEGPGAWLVVGLVGSTRLTPSESTVVDGEAREMTGLTSATLVLEPGEQVSVDAVAGSGLVVRFPASDHHRAG